MSLIRCRKNSHSVVVTFGSDTTVKLAYRLKAGLLKILKEPVEHYRFDLSGIIETDITFIQILIAFRNTLNREDRRMSIVNCSDSSAFMDTCRVCGIDIRAQFEFER